MAGPADQDLAVLDIDINEQGNLILSTKGVGK